MKQCPGQMSMFSAEASRDLASRLAWPGSEEARRMTAISGRKCFELSKNCGPLGLLERMLLGSSHWGSTVCWLTWKASVTKQGRLYFRLVRSMLRMEETAARLWPTPAARDCKGPTAWSICRGRASATMPVNCPMRQSSGPHPPAGTGQAPRRQRPGREAWIYRRRCFGRHLLPLWQHTVGRMGETARGDQDCKGQPDCTQFLRPGHPLWWGRRTVGSSIRRGWRL